MKFASLHTRQGPRTERSAVTYLTYIPVGVTPRPQTDMDPNKSSHTVISKKETQGAELEENLKGEKEKTCIRWNGSGRSLGGGDIELNISLSCTLASWPPLSFLINATISVL